MLETLRISNISDHYEKLHFIFRNEIRVRIKASQSPLLPLQSVAKELEPGMWSKNLTLFRAAVFFLMKDYFISTIGKKLVIVVYML